MIVTLDLFSAATDTRTGAGAVLGRIADERGWGLDGGALYDVWDRHNKALQREARAPTTFTEVSREALRRAYDDLGLDPRSAGDDLARLHDAVGDWPLWPDVTEGLRRLADVARVGLLSNVDDHLARRTRAAALVDPGLLLTSQRLGAFKPSPEIYQRAASAVAPERLVHVAASARDVRGALEAGIAVVRLARPGHAVDPDGPRPTVEVSDAGELADVVLGA
ncbi:HAD-IA family hydrolase [Nocardioides nitrophenolicus]|uniref:HAD-IA family hydrolase n=1 Tax=Nocardioides nitrophenolicus TaxID=60489 RepID=UPI001958B91D|nr:HAD-IA family hydrolase [Nocardioides nitrophenolicus]MBM7516759.1 2-haloacid dehalogenase [Nocardioides nitrophenolicus]